MSKIQQRNLLVICAVILLAIVASSQLRSFADGGPVKTTHTADAFFYAGKWEVSPEAPVLRSGEHQIDMIAATDPHVITHRNKLYMYYTCVGTTDEKPEIPMTRICLATSSDGINWTRHPENPILEPARAPSWDSLGLETPFVLKDNTGFKLYYMGYDTDDGDSWLKGEGITLGSIGLALSGDGVHFGRSGPQPILNPGRGTGACRCGTWDSWALEGPWVIKSGGLYTMYYGGMGSLDGSKEINAIGFATSKDGKRWSRFGSNPIFDGQVNAWDRYHTVDPCVLVNNGRHYLWYQGSDTQTAQSFGNFQIGMATSENGKRWRRSSGNPVLRNGSAKRWNDFGVMAPSVLTSDSGPAQLFFHGMDQYPDPKNWSIGRAVPARP